jgi:hypothetical protein
MRLISLTCVSSDPTPNIWWPDIDWGMPGRGEARRFILVNPCHRGSTTRSSWRACSSCSECRHSQRRMMTILSTRLNNKKSGARRWSWVPGSRTRSAPQDLSDHISSGGQATSYDRSDRWSNTTTDRDFIDDYPIIRVSPHWDPNNEAWRTRNREAINSSSKCSTINRSTMIKSGSSSSSHTPLQLILQHILIAGATCGTNRGSHSRTIVCLVINKQCATNSEETYLSPISRARLVRTRQHDIFIHSRNLRPRSQRR